METFIFEKATPLLAVLQQLTDGSLDKWYDILLGQPHSVFNSAPYEFCVQVFVFHRKTGTFINSFPFEYDDSRRPLFLLGEFDATGQLTNFEVITNLNTFFNCYGIFCFFCQRFFRGRGTQHKCLKVPTCFTCKRPFLKRTSYVHKQVPNLFCDASLTANEGQYCKLCNIRFFSESCKTHHSKKVCRFGWSCRSCEKYTFCSTKFPNVKSIRENHICGKKQCYFCGTTKEKFHQCQFQVPKVPHFLTKLGFIELQCTGTTRTHCNTCFLQEETCTFCIDNNVSYTNICSILFENKKRESFDQATFFSDTSVEEKECVLEVQYLPKKCLSMSPYKPTFFKTTPKNRLNSSIFKKENSSALEQLFTYILDRKLFNITFISHDDETGGRVLEELAKCLLENGIMPNVVGTSRLWLIEIPQIGVRFISSLNYFHDSVLSQAKRMGIEPCFFPKRLNKKKYFDFEGKAPNFEDFFCAEDSEEVIKDKKSYFKKINHRIPWNFRDSLKQFCEFRLHVISRTNLKFISDAFALQTLLNTILSPKKEITFLMPYNPPFFTRATYAFHLLLTFTRPTSLKMARPPIRMTSSKQELEFCAYLRWKFPHLTFRDAWSPHGQITFKESFPDSFCEETKTAFYFNGCLIHGHPLADCKFKRKSTTTKNYFRVDLKEAYKTHVEKITSLKKNHPAEVLETETVWECQWRERKQTDKTIKEFLKLFIEPPLHRLDPEMAVRGGLNETFACRWLINKFEKFQYGDINSSYPFHAMGFLPVGDFKVRHSIWTRLFSWFFPTGLHRYSKKCVF